MKKIMFNDRYGLTQAVLEGRKTQTRRIVPDWMQYDCSHSSEREIKKGELRVDFGNGVQHGCRIPYKVGEIVAVSITYNDILEFMIEKKGGFGEEEAAFEEKYFKSAGWTNKMFVKADLMPCLIQITSVRIERLQDLSDFDCLAEGVLKYRRLVGTAGEFVVKDSKTNRNFLFNTAHQAFAYLIDKVSGKGTWERNPWVYVYEFQTAQ